MSSSRWVSFILLCCCLCYCPPTSVASPHQPIRNAKLWTAVVVQSRNSVLECESVALSASQCILSSLCGKLFMYISICVTVWWNIHISMSSAPAFKVFVHFGWQPSWTIKNVSLLPLTNRCQVQKYFVLGLCLPFLWGHSYFMPLLHDYWTWAVELCPEVDVLLICVLMSCSRVKEPVCQSSFVISGQEQLQDVHECKKSTPSDLVRADISYSCFFYSF